MTALRARCEHAVRRAVIVPCTVTHTVTHTETHTETHMTESHEDRHDQNRFMRRGSIAFGRRSVTTLIARITG